MFQYRSDSILSALYPCTTWVWYTMPKIRNSKNKNVGEIHPKMTNIFFKNPKSVTISSLLMGWRGGGFHLHNLFDTLMPGGGFHQQIFLSFISQKWLKMAFQNHAESISRTQIGLLRFWKCLFSISFIRFQRQKCRWYPPPQYKSQNLVVGEIHPPKSKYRVRNSFS